MFKRIQTNSIASTLALTLLTTATFAQSEIEIKAEIWADNWFALYINEELAGQDSVPFNTERSFNSEVFNFTAELPAQAAIIMKDYYENDTGLEYIGNRRQQMGDGGLRAQFKDAKTNLLIEASGHDWQCHVIHQAPLNKECARSNNPENECESLVSEEPKGWMSANFDDSRWNPATVHSSRAVRPHGGYSNIRWEDESELIWAEDLEVDNVVLCRFIISEY